MGVGGQCHALAALLAKRERVPILQEAGCASRPVWTDAENFAPTGIRTTDIQSRSESLY